MSKPQKRSLPKGSPREEAGPGRRRGSAGDEADLRASQAPGRDWKRLMGRGAILLVVLGIVLGTHWPVLSAGALYMDDLFYLRAPALRNPSSASVEKVFGEVLAPSVVKGYYHPLSLISVMLDFLDPDAAKDLRPFHRTSLLLHLLNVALVVLLLSLLFGNWWTSALMGLLYGLHPLNADGLLWIAERKSVLSTFFALWSMVLYVLYARHAEQTHRRDWKRYSAALLLCVCAVLSKPTATPLVALLLVLDFWPLQRLNRRAIVEKLPFLVVCALSALVTVISQTRTWDEGKVQVMHVLYLPFVTAYGVGLYLWKTLWPSGLVSDYPFPQPFSPTNPEVLLSNLGTLFFIVAMVVSLRRTRAWLAGGLFFLIAIFPAIGIVRFTSTVVANRFMVLPMVGLLLPLTWALSRLWNRSAGGLKSSGMRVVVLGTGAVLAMGSAGATRRYESRWHDTLTLLQYYLSQSPNSMKLHTRLGNEWIERGNYDSAIAEFTEAIRLGPGWTENRLNLGRALFTVGRFPEAQQAFAGALRQTPNDWRAHMLMSLALSRQNDLEGAFKELETAAQIVPMNPEVHFNMAGILAQQGKLDAAIKEYQQTLRLNPNFRGARSALDSLAPQQPHKL
jgi:protein O-mannosyl-transferase